MTCEREIIKKYLGIPYVHKGRSCDGLDCWGLIISVYRDFGIELFDFEDYSEDWSYKGDNHFIENYWKQWEPVSVAHPFHVVLFENHKHIANHAGLYLPGDRFLHCCKAGVVVTRMDEGRWPRRFVGFYRYKGATHD